LTEVEALAIAKTGDAPGNPETRGWPLPKRWLPQSTTLPSLPLHT